jgi:hypothetical protein
MFKMIEITARSIMKVKQIGLSVTNIRVINPRDAERCRA